MSHQICIGFVEVGFVPAGWTWCIYPYSYGLLHWWRYNHIIIPVTVKKNLQDMGKIGQTNDKETWHARTICIILDVCCIQSFEINYHHDFNLRKHVVVVNRIIVTIRSTHYCDVIMGAMASQITSLTIVCSTVYTGANQRKHQSSASLAFVQGIHRWPVNSPHKGPVTRKMFPYDDVIMSWGHEHLVSS